LGEALTLELVKEIGPDAVIIATGSEPLWPDIPGIDPETVVTARDALMGATVGQKIVVIGGGLVGCETADHLAQQGKELTIIEMLRFVGQDVAPAARHFLLKRLDENGVKAVTSATVTAVTNGDVLVNTKDGEQKLGPFDTIILAAGAKPVNDLKSELNGMVPSIHVIGDAVSPGKILEATTQGAAIARGL
ncbi:FAD/NAD(P)-binding oxidoreductase, partial [Thermodesulfobacteriota bacterium]